MKRNIQGIFAACMAALVFSLSACGGGDSGTAQSTAAVTTQEQSGGAQAAADEGYAFFPKGVASANNPQIRMDMKMEELLTALGEPNSYFEAPSCAFDGVDKTYTYSNFVIDTYPVDGVDLVSRVFLSNDLVSTSEGLAIGETKQKMIDLYGDSYETNGTECIYTKGSMKLRVIIEDEKVKTITYTSIAAESEF
ncbi:MAG: hypothetical protein IK016_03520 [Lachnospiraceae bacterium]|nr:hypothetical protein [Lachnospiraceae bacterium]